MKPQVAKLFRYPVKGLSPDALDRVKVEKNFGFPGDRIFAVALPNNNFDENDPQPKRKSDFLILAKYPSLATIDASFDHEKRSLTLKTDGGAITVSIDDDDGRQKINEFLKPFYPKAQHSDDELRFVRGDKEHRFTDVSPHSRKMMQALSLINLNSVRELEKITGQKLDVRRFRANIVVDGLPAWEEQDLFEKEFTIGGVKFEGVWPTSRCPATQANPDTGQRDINIPKLLKENFGHQNLGIYISACSDGELQIGHEMVHSVSSGFQPHIAYTGKAGESHNNEERSEFAQKLTSNYDLTEADATIIANHPSAFDYFIHASSLLKDKSLLAKWLNNELFGRLKKTGVTIDQCPVTASDFGKLCGLLETNKINAADLKKALDELWTEKSNVDEIVSKIGARQSLDHETLKQICLRIVDENPKNVASYKAGKTNLLGWFMGQVMKETKGAADPKLTNDCIIELISK